MIGTAGHVDHGKTTLIQALTGIDADRLPEEKARGMTIDIGFAYLDSPKHGRVSIVDVPGHERFIANMLVGALGIDAALLCVSADEGVMPQTREHLQILELLPVDKMVVALTRSDLVDAEMVELVSAEVLDLLEGTRFKNSPVVPVSALKNQGLDALRTALDLALDAVEVSSEGPWYLPIDRVFSVKGHGCVVTGTLIQGSLKVGELAVIEPGALEVRVRAIHIHGEPREQSERGCRTALNLGGVKLEDVERGVTIGKPGTVFATNMLDAKVRWIAPIKHGLRVRLSIGSKEAIGKLFLNDSDPDLAQIRLETEVAAAIGQPIIIRRYSPPEVLGGGRVVVPQAKIRRKSESSKTVVAGGDDKQRILEAVGDSQNGVMTDEICRLLGRSAQAIGKAFEHLLESGELVGFAGLWFQPGAFEGAAQRLLKALMELHELSPTQAVIPRDKAVLRAGLKLSGKPLDRILSELARQGRIQVEGTNIRHPAFSISLSDKQRVFLDRIKEVLLKSGLNVPADRDIALALGVPVQAATEMLRLGVEAGELVRVFEGIYYAKEQLVALETALRERFGASAFTAAEFRDAMNTSRKYAIPLLEYLDGVKATLRTGDARVLRRR